MQSHARLLSNELIQGRRVGQGEEAPVWELNDAPILKKKEYETFTQWGLE